MLEDGQRAKAKLQTVSVTGGLLRLGRSLSQGDFVEVAFQIHSGAVRGMAEMLSPIRATGDGSLQPFRFVALGDDDHRTLRMAVDSTTDRSFQGLRPASGRRPNQSRQLRELQVRRRDVACPVSLFNGHLCIAGQSTARDLFVSIAFPRQCPDLLDGNTSRVCGILSSFAVLGYSFAMT